MINYLNSPYQAVFAVGMAVYLMLAPAVSGSAEPADDKIDMKTDLGVSNTFGNSDNARYNEYKYNNRSDLDLSGKINLFAEPVKTGIKTEVDVDAASSEEVNILWRTWLGSDWELDLGFNRMVHNFATDARSYYQGAGSNSLTISDSVQQRIEGSINTVDTLANINALATQIDLLDVGLRRDNATVELKKRFDNLVFGAFLNYEERTGMRPNTLTVDATTLETLEPTNYQTVRTGGTIEYAGDLGYGKLHYTYSEFDDKYNSLTVDNPMRLTYYKTSATASMYPDKGRMALPPDNDADMYGLVFRRDFSLWDSRFTGSVDVSRYHQDDAFVTTTNALQNVPLPAASGNMKVEQEKYVAKYEARPWERLGVTLDFLYENHDNVSTPLNPDTSISLDKNATARGIVAGNVAYKPIYVSYVEKAGGVELDYELTEATEVSLGCEIEKAYIDNGSAWQEQIGIYSAGIEHEFERGDIKLGYEYTDKNSKYPDYKALDLPWMRKYYAASKERNQVTASLAYELREQVSLDLEYRYGRDDYNESLMGLLEDESHFGAVEIDWAPSERFDMNLFGSYETQKSFQRNRQWTTGGTGSPYLAAGTYADPLNDPSNWELELDEKIWTVGLGTKRNLIRNKLNFLLSGTYSVVSNEGDFSSVNGAIGAKADNNAFNPQDWDHIDESQEIIADASLMYTPKPDCALSLGYRFEDWRNDDFTLDGYTPVFTTTAGAYNNFISMDTLYKKYTTNKIYTNISVKF